MDTITLHPAEQDMNLDLGIEELDEMVDPGFWDTAAGVAVGTVVAGGIVYGGAILLAT
jgi:hypothetical protein